MKEENIRKYAELMKELSLTGMEITEDGTTVRLERMPAPEPVRMVSVNDDAAERPVQVRQEEKNSGSAVTSPMVGIFYAAPAENAEPYVKVGDRVKKGDTLCIIEAMKLMNEIVAECDGTIAEVCLANGDVVEYGTVLFKIER